MSFKYRKERQVSLISQGKGQTNEAEIAQDLLQARDHSPKLQEEKGRRKLTRAIPAGTPEQVQGQRNAIHRSG